MDTCGGFDLIWVDGSTTPEGRALPHTVKPHNFRIAEVYQDFRPRYPDPLKRFPGTLGSDLAIVFGMGRLLDAGYDYCGIIENDVSFEPNWLPRLMELFDLGARDGFKVGAATARSIATRVMFRRPGYLAMWNIGAGMVLFSREAARITMRTYSNSSAKKLARIYKKTFGIDLRDVWELWNDQKDRRLCPDWQFSSHLYEHGFASLGTIPSLAFNIDMRIEEVLRSAYVREAEEIPFGNDHAFAIFKGALAAATASPRSHRLIASVVDSARSKLCRAQLYSKFVRDSAYWVARALQPVQSTRALIRRAKRSLNLVGEGR
jgi:hypothetical protein